MREIIFNNTGQVSHVIAFTQMRRAVCQRQLSFLLPGDVMLYCIMGRHDRD